MKDRICFFIGSEVKHPVYGSGDGVEYMEGKRLSMVGEGERGLCRWKVDDPVYCLPAGGGGGA